MLLAFFIAFACNYKTTNSNNCDKYIELSMAKTKSQPIQGAKIVVSPNAISSMREVILEDNRVLRITLKSKSGNYKNIFVEQNEYDYIFNQINCDN